MARNTPTRLPALPDCPQEQFLSPLTAGALQTQGEYEEILLSMLDLSQTRLPGMQINAAICNRVQARGTHWRDLHLRDVRLNGCDLANGDWLGTRLHRVEVTDSRLTGLSLGESTLADVRFSNCKADAAWFKNSAWERCILERCDLHEANFEGAKLNGVIFRDCDLRQVRFTGAQMEGADLRGSQLQGLIAEPGDLRGCIIEPLQASDIIEILGVVLRPRD